jgi:hypothetical protein
MLSNKQIAALPDANDPSLALAEGERTDDIRSAYSAIAPMFWGSRFKLDSACASSAPGFSDPRSKSGKA